MAVREKPEATKPAEGHVAALESNLSKKGTEPSPFLGELSQITGPAATKAAVDKLDKDGFTGRAEAIEAQKILGDAHGIKNIWGGGSITPDDVKKYSERPGLSDGERAYAKKLGEDFKKISGDGGQTITQKDIYAAQAKEQQHADLTNFYAKDPATGKSLADGLKNENGGISGQKLDEKLKDPKLTDKDRASLDAVNKLRETSWGSPTGDVSAGKMLDATKDAKLTPKEVAGTVKTGDPKSADTQEAAAALKDLTSKPGGGQSLLDKIGDGKGGVDYNKTEDLLAHPERHNLTPENVKTLKTLDGKFDPENPGSGLSKQDLQKMGAESGVDYDKLTARPATPAESADQKGREKEFGHLLEKGADGKSLYDRLKDKDGGISGAKLDEELKKPGLSKDDRDTIGYLKTLQNDGNVYGKKDLTKDDIVSKAHEHNINDASIKKAGLNPDKPADQAAPTAAGDIKAEGHKALVVHSGQGYFHVAERLLSEAHKGDKKYEPTQKELKELVNQLRHANGNRTSLNSKEELKIDDAIKHNPALAGLFA